MNYGHQVERAIDYAKKSCEHRERDIVVWRSSIGVGVSSSLPADAKLIGTARFVGRAVLWEPAPLTGVVR